MGGKQRNSGQSRVSRRGKVSRTFPRSPICRFRPSPADIGRLEWALGAKFGAADRERLVEVIDNYFAKVALERDAPRAYDVELYLNKLVKSGNAFLNLIYRGGNPAIAHARIIIDRELVRQPKLANLHKTLDSLEVLVSAIRRVLNQAQHHPTVIDGNAWRNLIQDLTAFCRERKFRTGAAKDGLTSSPFVNFLAELQLMFPADHRHHSGRAALSKAISDARRKRDVS